MKLLFFFIALVFIAFISPVLAQDEKAELTKLMAEFTDAWNKDDIEAIKSQLANDVVFNKKPEHIRGLQAVMDEFVKKETAATRNFSVTAVKDNDVFGNLAMQSGQWAAESADGSARLSGVYTFMWTKKDGPWKLHSIHLETQVP